MAETYYGSNRPMTLQDLLAHANSQPDAPVATPLPPDASQVDIPGATSPQDRQKLLDMLMAPDDVGPAPQVDKANAMSLLFTGLGDAMNAMVAGQTGNPGMRSDAMGQYLRTIESQKQDLRDYQQRKGMAHNVSKNRTAQYLLSEMDRKDSRAMMVADRAAAAKEAAAYKESPLKQQRDLAAAADAAQVARDEAQFKRQKELLGYTNAHDLAMERVREGIRQGDKIAHQDDGKISEAKGYIGTLADNLDAILQTSDPDTVRTRARRFIDRLNLSPDARKAVDAYFNMEVGPALVDKTSADLEAGSPQQSQLATAMGTTYDPTAFAAGAQKISLPSLDPKMGMALNRRAP